MSIPPLFCCFLRMLTRLHHRRPSFSQLFYLLGTVSYIHPKMWFIASTCAPMRRRMFSTFRSLQHDNPLVFHLCIFLQMNCLQLYLRLHANDISQGLPRSGTPPSLKSRRGLPQKRKIRDVKKVIAVSSAKGGVGKSTVAGRSIIFSTT